MKTVGVLIFMVVIILFCACNNNDEILLNKDESMLSDYRIIDEEVYFDCILAITNSTGTEQKVKILATSDEDVRLGLLKHAELIGYDEDLSSDIFTIPCGENSVGVIFIGEFAECELKNDRLVPDKIFFEIIN